MDTGQPFPYHQTVDVSKSCDVTNRVVVAVDDDFRVRESIARLAASAGLEVEVFRSAEELLVSAVLARAGCLITDVRMPGMDGLELQRRVQTTHPRLPVILISAHVDEAVRQRSLDEGAFEFLYKPFDGEELLRAMQKALEQSPER
jgi:two-component system response regulator FixJ